MYENKFGGILLFIYRKCDAIVAAKQAFPKMFEFTKLEIRCEIFNCIEAWNDLPELDKVTEVLEEAFRNVKTIVDNAVICYGTMISKGEFISAYESALKKGLAQIDKTEPSKRKVVYSAVMILVFKYCFVTNDWREEVGGDIKWFDLPEESFEVISSSFERHAREEVQLKEIKKAHSAYLLDAEEKVRDQLCLVDRNQCMLTHENILFLMRTKE